MLDEYELLVKSLEKALIDLPKNDSDYDLFSEVKDKLINIREDSGRHSKLRKTLILQLGKYIEIRNLTNSEDKKLKELYDILAADVTKSYSDREKLLEKYKIGQDLIIDPMSSMLTSFKLNEFHSTKNNTGLLKLDVMQVRINMALLEIENQINNMPDILLQEFRKESIKKKAKSFKDKFKKSKRDKAELLIDYINIFSDLADLIPKSIIHMLRYYFGDDIDLTSTTGRKFVKELASRLINFTALNINIFNSIYILKVDMNSLLEEFSIVYSYKAKDEWLKTNSVSESLLNDLCLFINLKSDPEFLQELSKNYSILTDKLMNYSVTISKTIRTSGISKEIDIALKLAC